MSGNASRGKWPQGAAQERQRGAVLFIILVFMAFTAGLYATILHFATSSGRAAAVFANAMRADEIGRASVDLVASAAASDDPGAKRGGSFSASFGDATAAINYVSEAARIDVNQAPPEFLGALFQAAGLEPGQVSQIVERIKASRKPANGGANQQAGQPGQTQPGQPPAGQPQGQGAPGQTQGQLEHIDLITAAWGLPNDLFLIVSPALTVANGTSTVDPTIANRLIIAALFGGEGERVSEFLERRRRGFLSENEALTQFPPDKQKFVAFSPANAFRAIADVKIGNRLDRKYEFVIASPEKSGTSVKTFSWRILP